MIIPTSVLTPIEILVNVILQQYFSTSYCVTVVSERPLDLLMTTNFMSLHPDDGLVSQLLNASESGCSDYVINMKKPSMFMKAFEEVVHIGDVRRSYRKLLFLPFANNNDSLYILTMKATTYVPNVLLLLPTINDSREAFDLVTHKYVGNSQPNDVLLLDQWDPIKEQFVKNSNIFPHDMSDLGGKIVKVAAFTYKPYVLLDINETVTAGGIDGTEIRIIIEFCRWINCKIEIIDEKENEWGEIYENQTGIGVLGSVVEDRSDFGITALYSWFEEFLVMDFSASCIRTAITCIAPSPRLILSWETPLMPFSIQMWLALLLTFVFASIAMTVAQGFSTDRVFLRTFGMMITQSQPERQTAWRIRSVTGWLLLTGLIIDNAYGGGLASVFTVPKYEDSIDTIKDIVEQKIEWGATHEAWVFSLTLSQDELIKKLVSQFHTYTYDELKSKSLTRSMSFSVERLPAGYFAIGEYITEDSLRDMTLMLEDFYYEHTVVMMRKSSPFTEKISTLVGRLHQSGLMLAWERQVALKYLNYNIQLEVKLSRSKRDVENVEAINVKQVMGIFLFYGAGVITSVFIFMFEWLQGRNNKMNLKLN